jgi:acyl carrier protein
MERLISELKEKIISSLNLSDITPEQIDPDAPLVGAGLNLDSIDTLELIVLMEKDYGVTVPDVNTGRSIFSSLRSLAGYIDKNRYTASGPQVSQ